MKTFLAITLFAVSTVGLVSHTAFAADPRTVTLEVKDMTCASCPLTVSKVLKKQPGVSQASVDYKSRIALVTFDPEKINPEQLAKAVTEFGFPTTVK